MNKIKRNKESLKILFVNFAARLGWVKEKTKIDFPMGLCLVASETQRNGYNFTVLDLRAYPMADDELKNAIRVGGYDVVAFGGLITQYNIIKPFVELVREGLPQSIIIVGNSMVAPIPMKFLQWTKADIVVIGEGEYTFVDILDTIVSGGDFSNVKGIAYKENGKVFITPPCTPLSDLNKKEFPRWDIFDVEAYIKSFGNYTHVRYGDFSERRPFPINSVRGCPFRCNFCGNSYLYDLNPIRAFSPEYIVRIIKTLIERYKVNFIWFQDELTFATVKNAEPIIDALLKADLGIQFEVSVRVGFLKEGDVDFAKKMREAGCVSVNYGLESGSPTILKAMNKKIRVEDFYTQKKVFDIAEIVSGTCIIFGYPQETEETMIETFNVLYETEMFPTTGFLLPIPGTHMYKYAGDNGFIKDEEEYILEMGEKQELSLNMTKMSTERIIELCRYYLGRIRDKMGLDLDDDHLIKSTIFKG